MKFTDKQEFEKVNKFGTGAPNTAYAKFFIGDSSKSFFCRTQYQLC